SRRRHTRSTRDWSSDVCSSDLLRRSPYRKDPATRNARFSEDSQGEVCRFEDTGWLYHPVMSFLQRPGLCLSACVLAATGAMAQKIGRASCRERGEAQEVDWVS